ncbi:MAG: ATP-binding protein [Gammaproteobacteria bacterium]|nr:ATP-binding protein [Gammaproteobacteria bacterium]MBU1646031.1 ATP-binding protein [Gammaproteobacteria bacterium]MBU1972093.1 ATP-binding protein [Gammaproteobacteria bacterium]
MPDNPLSAVPAAIARYFRRLGHGQVAAEPATDDGETRYHPCQGRADRVAAELTGRALPPALLDAFQPAPLGPGSPLFVGREAYLQRLQKTVDAWRQQRPELVAVVGPPGCGVTSLLRQIETLLEAGERVDYHALDGRPASAVDALASCAALFDIATVPGSVEELAARINALEPRLIVLDNGHFLACRIMGASQAVRTFGALMVATQERHQWVLGCNDEAWRRLGYVHRADRFFEEVIELAPFEREGLGALLAARLRSAGVALALPEGEAADPAAAEDTDAPAAVGLTDSRIATLQQLSLGRPAPAFFHLLRALEVPTDATALILHPFVRFDYAALDALARMEMFTLAEIAVHGGLTAPEHCSLLHLADHDSQMLLQRLCAMGLLERPAGDTLRYRLVPVHVGAVTQRLHKANYLY